MASHILQTPNLVPLPPSQSQSSRAIVLNTRIKTRPAPEGAPLSHSVKGPWLGAPHCPELGGRWLRDGKHRSWFSEGRLLPGEPRTQYPSLGSPRVRGCQAPAGRWPRVPSSFHGRGPVLDPGSQTVGTGTSPCSRALTPTHGARRGHRLQLGGLWSSQVLRWMP